MSNAIVLTESHDTVEAANNRVIAHTWLSRHGYGKIAVIAIMRNLQFDDLARDGGIANWNADRLILLEDYCSVHHQNPKTLKAQLGFLHHELRGVFGQTIGAKIDAARDVAEASEIFAPYVRMKGNSVK